MRAQVASLVLLALFVSAQAGFISISKDGSGSFSNVLAAKAAGKGVIITKGTTEAASGRAAAQPALVTAVAAKSVDGKVDAAKSVDVKGDAAKADVKVETAAPQAKKEEVKAAAPAPAPKAEPKKEEPKAAAAPAPAPKKEEPKKAEAQATVVAAKPAEAPKQAAAAAAMTVDKKVDVQVAAPVVKQVQAANTVSVDIHAGKGGVSKSVIVDGGRKLQGLGKAAGAVSISVSPQQRAPAPRRVDSTPGKGFGLSKSITFGGDKSGRQAAAAAAAKTVSKEVAGPQITKFASVSADKSAAVQGRKLQGGKGGSVSVVGGDSNSVRAAAVAPSKVNGGASFSKSISKSFSLPTISISKVAEATATQTFSASKVLAAPQVTKSAIFKLGRKLQGGSLNAAFSVGKDGAALGNGRAAAPAPRQTASTTGKGFSASKVITFPQITLPSFTKTVSKSGK